MNLIFQYEITFKKNNLSSLSQKLSYIASEGAVSHNLLYYQQLSIARYQASFNAKNYFE